MKKLLYPFAAIGKVTIGRKEGPVIESPFVYKP